ncbi:MAG: ATP-binding protein [Okeania sp. SIO2D1]|nr:ATP-binding protein [Okeania sp. SIO2D1]
MTMKEVFGDFLEDVPTNNEFLMIGFLPYSVPLKQRWRNNGLSADFVADYLTTFFPAIEEEPASIERKEEIKSAVNYVANELLDNAMKFNDENARHPVKFGLHILSRKIVLFSSNCVSGVVLEKFLHFVRQIISSDTQELYIQQLEMGMEENSHDSRLGFLTVINDYGVQLGWKVETLEEKPEITKVTTMAQIII